MSEPIETPKPETPAQGSQPATPQGNEGGSPEPTFTQVEMDKTMGKVRAEAREATTKKLLEDLGIEDLDTARALLAETKKRKEAEMSELEKAQTAIDAANKKALEAEQKVQEMQASILANGRKQAFLKAANDSGGQNLDDLFILVQASMNSDFESVFGDDALPDEGKMKKFIADVQKAKPAYFKSSGAGSPSTSNGIAPRSTDNTEQAAEEWLRKLRS
jgi:hypothetical protein